MWRRIRTASPSYSFAAALRITWLPMLTVVVMLGLMGLAFQWVEPAAKSIGDVFRQEPH